MKRILSLVLAAVMIAGLCGVVSSGADTAIGSGITFENTGAKYTNYADQNRYPAVTAVSKKISAWYGQLDCLLRSDYSYETLPGSLGNATNDSTNWGVTIYRTADAKYDVDNDTTTADTVGPLSQAWIAIDLGEERSFDEIEIYQKYNRLANVKVHALTEMGWNKAKEWNQFYVFPEIEDNTYATLLKDQEIAHSVSDGGELNAAKDELTTPSTVSMDKVETARYILLRMSLRATSLVFEIRVKEAQPTYNYADQNIYPAVTAVSKKVDGTYYGKLDCLLRSDYKYDTLPTILGTNAVNDSTNQTVTFPRGKDIMYDDDDDETTANVNGFNYVAIDLGAERTFSEIEIYQKKDYIQKIFVYSLTAEGYERAKSNNAFNIDNETIKEAKYSSQLAEKTISATSADLNTAKDKLIKPTVVQTGGEKTARYILIRMQASNNFPVYEIRVLGNKAPAVSDVTAYPTGGLNYKAMLNNGSDKTQRLAVISAQYDADEMISDIKFDCVDVPANTVRGFCGNITEPTNGKTVRVYTLNLDTLLPLSQMYAFSAQQ